MKIGDIFVVSGNSIISKAIQKTVGSKWTHVALYVGGGYVLEIDWNTKATLVKDPYTFGEFEHVVLRSKKPLTANQQVNITSNACAFNKTGNRYDWLMLINLFLKTKFPNTKLLKHLNGKNTYVCTELVDEVFRRVGIELFPEKDGVIYPHDFIACDKLQIVDSEFSRICN